MPAKNEYQSLVSPIVRSGGLPRPDHNRHMNAPKITEDEAANAIEAFLHPNNAKTAPAKETPIAATAKYMNKSHPIISEDLLQTT
jgi:hypothetical protein